MPKLSIILVNYNEREYLRNVLQLLQNEFDRELAEVIVVDNNSHDQSLEMADREFPWIKAIQTGKNLMYGKGNNVGFQHATGEWLMVLNPDVAWQPGALRAFYTAATALPNLGAAGPQIRYSDGRIQVTSHHSFPTWRSVFVDYCLPVQQVLLRSTRHPYLNSTAAHEKTHRTATMTGVCLLVPRETYTRIGGFDPNFTMYLEETEWQKRMAENGLGRWFIAGQGITHFGSAQKSFSQANRHYLWGLEYYTRKHWRGALRRERLLVAMWLGALLSLIGLVIAWPFSWIAGRPGRRIRHYLRQYGRLVSSLLHFPTQAPVV